MKIAVIGLGYVGLTGAGCMLSDGHEVIGYEPNHEKIKLIKSGASPIYEPGLDALLQLGLNEGRLDLRLSIDEEINTCDLAIVCVGTPSSQEGSHNMTFIADVSRQLANAISNQPNGKRVTIAYRSTFKPGTIEQLIVPIFKNFLGSTVDQRIELVYNPEFMRESVAINDYFNPPKIVIGTHDGSPSSVMDELYAKIPAKRFYTRFKEAEITKFVDNSFHAVKVSFANEVGRICRLMDIDPAKVHEIFISDTKLNISPYYLRPGGAFGGSCLPKDVRAFSSIARELDAESVLIDSLLKSNEAHKRFLLRLVTQQTKPGAKLLMLGISFKANSDDLRESPHIDLARSLIAQGYDLSIFEPHINPKTLLGSNLGYTFANLPSIGERLIQEVDLAKHSFEAIIDTNGTAAQFPFGSTKIININAL